MCSVDSATKLVCLDDDIWSQEPVIHKAESEDEDVSRIFVEMLERDIRFRQEDDLL